MKIDRCVIVRRKTELEELLYRYNMASQVEFYLKSAGEDYAPIHRRHETYVKALAELQQILPLELKSVVIDRSLLPQFDFQSDVVFAIGQDGLVSNTAKYLNGQPLIGVNPDPEFFEGLLLPWTSDSASIALRRVMRGSASIQEVTLALAQTSDGRELLAFNDLFIGQSGHASARYEMEYREMHEFQSSSGIIVSTGAGSTGWLRSVQFGAQKVSSLISGTELAPSIPPLARDTAQLVFAVREPWPSRTTGASIVYGTITSDTPLLVNSRMPTNGVIFSDGIEWDYLEFNSGTRATITIAPQKSNLVIP